VPVVDYRIQPKTASRPVLDDGWRALVAAVCSARCAMLTWQQRRNS